MSPIRGANTHACSRRLFVAVVCLMQIV